MCQRPGQFVELCCCFSLDISFRIFNCARCAAQVILCRDCDRGNIYCSDQCSSIRRTESLRAAGERYRQTFPAKLKAAARQAKRRERISAAKEKVTHHSSNPVVEHVESDETETVEASTSTQPITQFLSPPIRCHCCKRICGQFARFEFWRGGRTFRRLRSTNETDTRT